MTIRELLRRQPTESQYEILQRADRIFKGQRGGRFFGGQLSASELTDLTHGVELRKGTLPEPQEG
jgi:hypothetical protein